MEIRNMYKVSGGAVFNRVCGDCGFYEQQRGMGVCWHEKDENWVKQTTIACKFFTEVKDMQMSLFDMPGLIAGGVERSAPKKKRSRTARVAR